MMRSRIGIAGYGSIGRDIVRYLDSNRSNFELAGIAARHPDKLRNLLSEEGRSQDLAFSIEALASRCDVLIEAAPATAFRSIAQVALKARLTMIVLSAGALLENWDLVKQERRAHLFVPSGAIAGIDAIRAAAVHGNIHKLTLKSLKPPRNLADVPYVTANNFSLMSLSAARCIFRGGALDAVRNFPANANIAAILALAVRDPEKVSVEIWADPATERNMHFISVSSDIVDLNIEIKAWPSMENPKSSILAAASAIAAMERLAASVQVGS